MEGCYLPADRERLVVREFQPGPDPFLNLMPGGLWFGRKSVTDFPKDSAPSPPGDLKLRIDPVRGGLAGFVAADNSLNLHFDLSEILMEIMERGAHRGSFANYNNITVISGRQLILQLSGIPGVSGNGNGSWLDHGSGTLKSHHQTRPDSTLVTESTICAFSWSNQNIPARASAPANCLRGSCGAGWAWSGSLTACAAMVCGCSDSPLPAAAPGGQLLSNCKPVGASTPLLKPVRSKGGTNSPIHGAGILFSTSRLIKTSRARRHAK